LLDNAKIECSIEDDGVIDENDVLTKVDGFFSNTNADQGEDNELETMRGELIGVFGKKLMDSLYKLIACNVRLLVKFRQMISCLI
jgi:hypothetical protein